MTRQDDDPPVQCWHTEPDTPCDRNICRQPERLAAGDRGTDPAKHPVGAPDDPRWEWIYVGTHDDPNRWIKGRCNHLNTVPVMQSAPLGGAVVAHLCADCDAQLPAGWRYVEGGRR